MNTDSLWPEFADDNLVTPLSILKEQSNYLSEKTGNLIEGEVDSRQVANNKFQPNGKGIQHVFYVKAPVINNYKFLLLTATHDLRIYPLYISFPMGSTKFTCNNQDEFIEKLSEIFKDDSVQKAINALIAQSK